METRGCRHLHFIAAIKSGSVAKLRNVTSCGKPTLRSKSLKDVFEFEDAKKSTSDSAVEDNKVKTEASCLPLADRTLWKEDFESFELVSNGDDDEMSDDSSVTLSQLKRKKQKLSHGTHSNAKQVNDNFQFGEDEFDLKEPLIHWKLKLVKKTPKRKRKLSSERAITLELAHLGMLEEPIVGSETFAYANRDLMSLVCVKREDPESESFEVPSQIGFIDVKNDEEPEYGPKIPDEVLDGNANTNRELVLYGDRYQDYIPDPSEDIEIDGCDSFQQVLCLEECRNCALNEVCYDHLEPIPLLELSSSNIVHISDEMMSCQLHLVSSTPEFDSNESDNNFSRSTREFMPQKDQICQALNCEEFLNEAEEYKYKEKLFHGGQINTNPSIARSNIETARKAEFTAQARQLNRRRVVISPSQILQKAKTGKHGSIPKGNLQEPCYSRSLPCINTGCTSVTSCSKGAIAFSQRQMHDIDSLAGKLLTELRSMKKIVEQKLLLNSCRNLTLKNDADEVVQAIKTATKVEQNTERLLSVMARDCNRYCKIMSLTRDGPSSNENEIHKEKRKIVFADEAGEMLCHVKFFEYDLTSIHPLAQEPDNQNR